MPDAINQRQAASHRTVNDSRNVKRMSEISLGSLRYQASEMN